MEAFGVGYTLGNLAIGAIAKPQGQKISKAMWTILGGVDEQHDMVTRDWFLGECLHLKCHPASKVGDWNTG